jgi:hypothetical protein
MYEMERSARSTQARVVILVLAFVSILAVGYVDGRSSVHIAFSVFYVIPIFLVSWFGNRILAALAAAASALCGLAADSWSSGAHSAYRFVNLGTRFALFLIVAWAFARLHAALGKEQELARAQAALAEQERELRVLQGALMRRVIEDSREPLGDIYARVVDLSFDGHEMTEHDKQQLLSELAEASLKMSRLIETLEVSESSARAAAPSAPR